MHRSVLLAALLLTVAIAGAQAPKIAGCRWTDATHGWECQAPLAAPSLIVTDGDKRTPLAPVFDSATVGSCTGRKAVAGQLAYCDDAGVLRPVTGTVTQTCPNGVIEGSEACDGAALGACATCTTDCSCGPTTTTTLVCSACSPTCGAGFTCNTNTCECEPNSPPVAQCGNGTIEGTETCDPGGKACTGQTDCGVTGACTASYCVAVSGSCTYGCRGDCTCTPAPTCTGDYFVRKDGSNSNNGLADTSAGAWLTITKALTTTLTDQNANGSITVCVGSGTYEERVIPTITGTAALPLILKTVSGAVIDPSTAATTGWTAVANGTTSTDQRFAATSYVYRQDFGSRQELLIVDGKSVPVARHCQSSCSETLDGLSATEWAAWFNGGPMTCSTSCCNCSRTASWTITDTVWGFDRGAYTYIGFETNTTPAAHTIRRMPKFQGAIELNGASYLSIVGFTIKNAWAGIFVSENKTSTNVTIQGNTFEGFEQAIYSPSNSTASTFTVEENSFDQKTYLKAGITMSAADPSHNRIWQWYKYGNDSADRNGVRADGPASTWIVRNNRFVNMFQGIAPGPSYDDWTVNDNSFENITDEALDNAAGGNSITIRDNEVRNANNGFRLRATAGTTAVYRNRVHIDPVTAQAEGMLIYLTGGTNATQRIYHNSMNGKVCVATGSGLSPVGTLTNTWFVDNICSTSIGTDAFSSIDLVASQVLYNWWYALPASYTYTGTLGTKNLLSGDGRYWGILNPGTWDIRTDWPTAATDPKNAGIQINTTQASIAGTPWSLVSDGRGYDATPDMGARQYMAAGTSTTSTTTTTAASTTSTTTADVNWASNMDVVLRMESGAEATDAGGGGCTWADTNVDTSAAEYRQGAYSGVSDDAGDDQLGSTCTPIRYTGSFACGGWIYLNSAALASGGATITYEASFMGTISSPDGWTIKWTNSSDSVVFDTMNGTSDRCIATTTGAQTPNNTWHHVVGVFDDTNNRQYILLDGVLADISCSESGCTEDVTNYCTQADITPAAVQSRIFRDGSAGVAGNLDEIFCDQFDPADTDADGLLDVQSICRICSCGIGGELCTCAGTAWVDEGRNDSACNSCTLPTACNKASP